MIAARNVIKKYRMGNQIVSALSGVDLEVEPGEIVVVLGTSGSGKTTLLNIAAGLERPTKGELFIDKYKLNQLSERQMTLLRRRYIGFIFQLYNLVPSLTALENAVMPLVFEGVSPKEREKRGKTFLKQLGLGDRLLHRPGELSGGQRQRVAIARALINNPRVIFADEPTGNLDTRTTKEILALLLNIIRENGQTMLMVTHDTEVATYGDRVVEMVDGYITDIYSN